jgi:hypothetical protein
VQTPQFPTPKNGCRRLQRLEKGLGSHPESFLEPPLQRTRGNTDFGARLHESDGLIPVCHQVVQGLPRRAVPFGQTWLPRRGLNPQQERVQHLVFHHSRHVFVSELSRRATSQFTQTACFLMNRPPKLETTEPDPVANPPRRQRFIPDVACVLLDKLLGNARRHNYGGLKEMESCEF